MNHTLRDVLLGLAIGSLLWTCAHAQPINPRQEGTDWKADGLCIDWKVAVRDGKHLVIKCPVVQGTFVPQGVEVGADGYWVWLTILDIRVWCPKPKQLYARRSSKDGGLTLTCK